MRLWARIAASLAPAAAVFVLAGCTIGGSSSTGAENDRLRRENLELKQRVAALEAERDEAKAAAAQAGRAASMPNDVTAYLPRVAGVEIGRFSGLTPTSSAEPATGLVVYVEPYDGMQRFVQATGVLAVSATWFPDGEKGQREIDLGGRTLDAAAVRDSYRSGIAGTFYKIEMPLRSPVQPRRGSVRIRVELRDALSGAVYSATKQEDLSN